MSTYLIPKAAFSTELVEKKSRFISHTNRVKNEQEFRQFLQKIKSQYPDARHHCYGFRIGPLSSAKRGFSDDGEPSGTAGMPILNVIDHSDFSDIAVIVVRYFGGIKLGTGGLTRAYSKAAKLALNDQPAELYEPTSHISARCSFSKENLLRRTVAKHNGCIQQIDYSEDVIAAIDINEAGVDALRELGFINSK